MKIYIGTNKFIKILTTLKKHLVKHNYEVIDVNDGIKKDILDISIYVANCVVNDKESRGIIIDEYGSGGFIVASKINGTIVAQLSDEHSAHMTRDHNNTNIITLGAQLSAIEQIINIVERYLKTNFSAGRHLVRTDMLNAMIKQGD